MITAKTENSSSADFSFSLLDGRIVIPNSIVLLLFFVFHIFLGPIMRDAPVLATVHAAIVLLIGIGLALKKAPLHHLAYVCAYIVGAEVLWRMSGASIPWETGKYTIVALMVFTLFQRRLSRIPILPLLSFLLLLPSIPLTIEALGLSEARDAISFNLSGFFTIFVAATFFAQVEFSRQQIRQLLIIMIAPMLAIANIALNGIMTSQIVWIGDSNPATSGGYGPNQVSSMLGLGLLAAWLLVLNARNQIQIMFWLAIAGWLLVQSLLTFSRGGLLAAILAIGATVIQLIIARPKKGLRYLVLFGVAALFFFGLIMPQLEDLTKGALGMRFTDLDLTDRDAIAYGSLNLFLENPILGVGPGVAKLHVGIAAHTEFARLPAEHGLLGILSLISLLGLGLVTYWKTQHVYAKVIVLVAIVWSLLFMFHASMRVAAPSFMIGLVLANFDGA